MGCKKLAYAENFSSLKVVHSNFSGKENTGVGLEYFAFGETFVEEHSNTDRTPYLFNGKEQDEETGLYYYGARYYDARTSVWLSVDPLAEDFPNVTPYNYTLNNPINYIDPDGRSTEVIDNGDGNYQVVGGRLDDNDLGIYIVKANKDGKYERTGESIGESLFIDSFYNYDEAGPGPGFYGAIDANSTEGRDWLQNIFDNPPTLAGYVANADNYNYKDRGIAERTGEDQINYRYRGGQYSEGVFASARDVGNIAAGYVAGNGGLSYENTRFIFDSFQASGNSSILGGMWDTFKGTGRTDAPNSQSGQQSGWELGHNKYMQRVNQYWQRQWGR